MTGAELARQPTQPFHGKLDLLDFGGVGDALHHADGIAPHDTVGSQLVFLLETLHQRDQIVRVNIAAVIGGKRRGVMSF